MSTPKYQPPMQSRSEVELLEIYNHVDKYSQYAVIDSIVELENRGLANDEQLQTKENLENEIKLEEQRNRKVPISASLKRASLFIYIASILTLINYLLVKNYLNLEANLLDQRVALISFTIFFIALFTGYMVRLGRVWARNLFLILYALSIIPYSVAIYYGIAESLFLLIFSTLSLVFVTYTSLILYNKESNQWIQEQKARQSETELFN